MVSNHPSKFVAYLRVSTARQGASGLGLEAQRSAVQTYLVGGHGSMIAEFVEVESGKRDDRPQLAAALAACRLHRATLVMAKLDRLARNVRFIAGIMDSGVDFVACDMPHANRLTLHLMAAMAEHEAAAISERTKAALAAAKARGTKLGNPNGAVHLLAGCQDAARLSAISRKKRSLAQALGVYALIKEMRVNRVTTISALARELNWRGVPAPQGGNWQPAQVRRCLNIAELHEA